MKEQFYALLLDDYATVSFCSFAKGYYGTIDDISEFLLGLDGNESSKVAFEEFKKGNINAEHVVAYNNMKFLTPVIVHSKHDYVFEDKHWTHNNIYGCPYEMHAERIEAQQVIIHHENKFLRCIKATFYNLSYEDLIQDDKLVLVKKFWGHPNIYKTDFSNEGKSVIKSRFFVVEESYESYKEAIDSLNIEKITFKSLMDDVFGDG